MTEVYYKCDGCGKLGLNGPKGWWRGDRGFVDTRELAVACGTACIHNATTAMPKVQSWTLFSS